MESFAGRHFWKGNQYLTRTVCECLIARCFCCDLEVINILCEILCNALFFGLHPTTQLQVRAKFAEIYGLTAAGGVGVAGVRFEFDGDGVRDSDTPATLGMEDDNMIDVKVSSEREGE